MGYGRALVARSRLWCERLAPHSRVRPCHARTMEGAAAAAARPRGRAAPLWPRCRRGGAARAGAGEHRGDDQPDQPVAVRLLRADQQRHAGARAAPAQPQLQMGGARRPRRCAPIRAAPDLSADQPAQLQELACACSRQGSQTVRDAAAGLEACGGPATMGLIGWLPAAAAGADRAARPALAGGQPLPAYRRQGPAHRAAAVAPDRPQLLRLRQGAPPACPAALVPS